MSNRTKFTTHARARFIAVISETANVSAACRSLNISRRTAYDYREKFPEFAEQWDEAVETAVDKLEAEAWRRGHDGYDEPVFQGGDQVGVIRKYSDRMLEILLKGHRPNKFRERFEHTGANGGDIPFKFTINLGNSGNSGKDD